MREFKLPSGAMLKISPAPFAVSLALYQAVLRELKTVGMSGDTSVRELFKDLFCTGFSSKEIEACLQECLKRCTYNAGGADLKIDHDTFEAIDRRQDYMVVCAEVARDNIAPFVKSLYVEYKTTLEKFGVSTQG